MAASQTPRLPEPDPVGPHEPAPVPSPEPTEPAGPTRPRRLAEGFRQRSARLVRAMRVARFGRSRTGGRSFPGSGTLIPVFIAAVSLTGAAVTWRASDIGAQAAELDAQTVREVTEEQQITSQLHAIVAHDLRIFAAYEEHIRAWRGLQAEAEAAAADGDAELAGTLRYEAQGRLAQARSLRSQFRAFLPDFGTADGTVEYDEVLALDALIAGEARLRELDPAETQVRAAARHSQTIQLVAVVILLVGSLFLLTVAQLGQGVTRLWFGGLGALAAGISVVVFVAIGVATT